MKRVLFFLALSFPFFAWGQHNTKGYYKDIFMDSGIKIKPQLEVAQLLTARALSYAGLGATLIPDRAILPAQNGVHYYRLDHPQAVRNMMLVTNKRSYVSFALQRFMEAFSLVYSAE